MAHITVEAKEAIIKKALSRGSQSLAQFAKEHNLGCSTLQRWLRLKREGKPLSLKESSTSSSNISIPPLQHLLDTATLDEQAVGAYCRKHGIYNFQLQQWQDDLMSHPNNKKSTPKDSNELKKLRKENKLLKQDLKRKDKALAETSALLILKKKANLIWGDLEDD